MIRAAETAIARLREDQVGCSREATYEQYDLIAESPSVRIRRVNMDSVTDRRQQWCELQTRPLQASDAASRETDVAAFRETYTTGRKIGAGAFGTVFAAEHRGSGQRVAVKRLSENAQALGDIRTEVEVLRALEHPNIVRVLGVYRNGEYSEVFLVEELQVGGVGGIGGIGAIGAIGGVDGVDVLRVGWVSEQGRWGG